MTPPNGPSVDPYAHIQAEDMANEVRIFWGELAVIAVLALGAAVYAILG